MSISFSDGVLVFIEDDECKWILCEKDITEKFIQFMNFGELMPIDQINSRVDSNIFDIDNFQYIFIRFNSWGPCYIKNITTGDQKEIKYLQLNKTKNIMFIDKKELYKVSTLEML